MKFEDDLNAGETSSEDEDKLTQEGHELKDMLERDEGKESWVEHEHEDEDTNEDEHEYEADDENEDEGNDDDGENEDDPDRDEMKRTSALFLQG